MSHWAPDVRVQVESAGRVLQFRHTNRRWLVESVKLNGQELLADEMPGAAPEVVEHLRGLVAALFGEEE
jgi:hypothetical protein